MEWQWVRCNLCESDSPRPLLARDGYSVVRCAVCDLAYVNPQRGRKHLERLYNGEYFECGDGPYYRNYFAERRRRTAEFRRLIRKIEGFCAPGRLLDVGAAAGYLLDAARQSGWQTCGVEISERAAQFARRELGLDVRTGELPEVVFPEATFDVVTMADVIEHVQDPKANLRAAHRVLRPGGILVLSTPNIGGLGFRIFREGFVFIAPEVHLWYFTPRTMERLLAESGFQLLKIEYPYFDTSYFNLRELWNLATRMAMRAWFGSRRIVPSAPMPGNVMQIFARKTA